MPKSSRTSSKARTRPPADKSVKLDRVSNLTRDQDALEREPTFDGPQHKGDHKRTICFNPSCPDYGVERVGDAPCGCRRPRAISR